MFLPFCKLVPNKGADMLCLMRDTEAKEQNPCQLSCTSQLHTMTVCNFRVRLTGHQTHHQHKANLKQFSRKAGKLRQRSEELLFGLKENKRGRWTARLRDGRTCDLGLNWQRGERALWCVCVPILNLLHTIQLYFPRSPGWTNGLMLHALAQVQPSHMYIHTQCKFHCNMIHTHCYHARKIGGRETLTCHGKAARKCNLLGWEAEVEPKGGPGWPWPPWQRVWLFHTTNSEAHEVMHRLRELESHPVNSAGSKALGVPHVNNMRVYGGTGQFKLLKVKARWASWADRYFW